MKLVREIQGVDWDAKIRIYSIQFQMLKLLTRKETASVSDFTKRYGQSGIVRNLNNLQGLNPKWNKISGLKGVPLISKNEDNKYEITDLGLAVIANSDSTKRIIVSGDTARVCYEDIDKRFNFHGGPRVAGYFRSGEDYLCFDATDNTNVITERLSSETKAICWCQGKIEVI